MRVMKRLASLRSLAARRGDAVDEERVEAFGEREKVRRAQRSAAEIVEGKARDAVDRLGNAQSPAEQRDLHRLAARRAGEALERRVERRSARASSGQ